ncbi:hypothetical protein RHIZO_02685 [Rhizobiaceae bacterium]|nr:hypothetical protein RHIZO_02685 [Rhizobiaceae bacterium]
MENDWRAERGDQREAGVTQSWSPIHVALMFGAAAVAMALLLTPVFDRGTEGYLASADNLDRMTTGSTARRGGPQVYTIRKSVLQPSPDSVCVIRANGIRHGDC